MKFAFIVTGSIFLQSYWVSDILYDISIFLAADCIDATQEELFHVITQHGASFAYNKILGEFPTTLNSKVQSAMDKARYTLEESWTGTRIFS